MSLIRIVIGCVMGGLTLFVFGQETLGIITYAFVFMILWKMEDESPAK